MVYMFLADGFEEIEAITPLDILRRAGIAVTTVAITPESRTVTGARSIGVVADTHYSEANTSDARMLILPGGMPGTDNLNSSDWVKAQIKTAAAADTYIAAVCAAPLVLGSMGLLNSKRAVCFPGYEQELIGAILTDDQVVIDDNIITAKAAGTAAEFGFALVGVLKDTQTAEEIREKMFFV